MPLFKVPTASYHSDQKILPHALIGTALAFDNLIADAKQELDALKVAFSEKEHQEIEKKKEEAYQEALTIFNQHIFAFDAEVKTLRTHLMKQILPIALTAAKKIVGEQLTIHPETIVSMIQKQLIQCASCHKIKLLVSKEDKPILDQNRTVLKEKLDQVESFGIEESPDLQQGSCMIITEAGNINATLDQQWKALETAFSRYMKPL